MAGLTERDAKQGQGQRAATCSFSHCAVAAATASAGPSSRSGLCLETTHSSKAAQVHSAAEPCDDRGGSTILPSSQIEVRINYKYTTEFLLSSKIKLSTNCQISTMSDTTMYVMRSYIA